QSVQSQSNSCGRDQSCQDCAAPDRPTSSSRRSRTSLRSTATFGGALIPTRTVRPCTARMVNRTFRPITTSSPIRRDKTSITASVLETTPTATNQSVRHQANTPRPHLFAEQALEVLARVPQSFGHDLRILLRLREDDRALDGRDQKLGQAF